MNNVKKNNLERKIGKTELEKLISINYMFSTNNTMHKFGIEYSYIATAMGTMLNLYIF